MPFDPDVNRLIRSGYNARRNAFVNQIKAIVGTNPVAAYLPHRDDTTTSVCPISGRVWTAETLTNLCTNGGFETNVIGWTTGGTNTLASNATRALFGTKSGLFTYSNNTVYASFAITFAAAGTYQCTVNIFLTSTFDGQGIQITDNGTYVGATITVGTVDMTKTNQWQRVTAVFAVVAGDLIGTLVVLGTGTAPTVGRTLSIDGVQIELGNIPTPYIETNGGTATATANMNTTLKPLGLGTMRTFDGVTQYLSTPDTANLSFVEPVTMSVFVYANVTDTALARMFFTKRDGAAANEYLFFITGTDLMEVLFQDQSAGVAPTIISASAITQGSMRTFAFSYDGSGGATNMNGVNLYQDGIVLSTPTRTNSATYVAMEDLTAEVEIGATSVHTGSFFQGSIACVVAAAINASAAQQLAFTQACKNYFGS